MKVIIPVAGFGKRMRPHTFTKPKPLISIAGNTAVGFILDKLEGMDVSEIIFITGHLKEKFEEYIRAKYSFNVRFIEQRKINGTAGAILLAEQFIDEPVMIVFVDTVFEADLSLIDKLDESVSGIIWVKEVEDYSRFGVCVLENNYLKRIVEKPKEPISRLANIGLYYIRDHALLFEGIHNVFASNKTIGGEYFLTDAFSYMVGKGAKFLCPQVDGWYDVGKLETTLESNRELLKKHGTNFVESINSKIIQPVNIAKDVVIENSTVGPFVAIEEGCQIRNSIVEDSIVCVNTTLDSIHVSSSIIGEQCELSGTKKSLAHGIVNVNIGDFSSIKWQD